MSKLLVLSLDETTDNHGFIRTALQKAYGDEIQVIVESPLPKLGEMVDRIQRDANRICALVFDERMRDTGDCDYNGSELAETYRLFDPKIPIYILTSFVETVDSYDVEFVIDKGQIVDESKVIGIGERLRRHVNIFQDMSAKRNDRLRYLLVSQQSRELTHEELQELGHLENWRSRPIELDESSIAEAIRMKLDRQEALLAEIQSIIAMSETR